MCYAVKVLNHPSGAAGWSGRFFHAQKQRKADLRARHKKSGTSPLLTKHFKQEGEAFPHDK